MPSKKMWARRPMGYNGKELDRGQVFELAGLPNDGKLERLEYIKSLPPGARLAECGVCHGRFLDEDMRAGHGEKRHPERFREKSEADLEAEADAEERRMNVVAPINLERTAASQR